MTNSHSLSVITNSCVKSTPNSVKMPSDRDGNYRDGAGVHKNDRNIYSNRNYENINSISNKAAIFNKTKAVRFANQNDIDSEIEELEGLQGELFLEKLVELKENHRINMEISEHRYMNSVGIRF